MLPQELVVGRQIVGIPWLHVVEDGVVLLVVAFFHRFHSMLMVSEPLCQGIYGICAR